MKLTLSEKFQRDILTLSNSEKQRVCDIILKLPTAVRDTHRHLGVGLRKIHASGIFEARIGLGLRIIFGYESDTIYLHRVGNHNEIQKYLKNI